MLQSNQIVPAVPAVPDGAIVITDYYDAGGKYSALGQALPADSDGEKSLTAKNGDIIIVGDKQYKVTADSITMPFYTQPTRDQLLTWWLDYMNDWVAAGKVTAQ